MNRANPALLEVSNLRVRYRSELRPVTVVNDVSFGLRQAEILGIIGESGSGKSQILLAIMGLLGHHGVASGSIRLRGRSLLQSGDQELDAIRGTQLAMIFQDATTALNPFLRISTQLTEALIRHRGIQRVEAIRRSVSMLEQTGIPDARERIHRYPHELSGGMRQRVLISMALLCEPAILLADEPTSALDVTMQAQVLNLILDLRKRLGTSILFVTHDLGVAASVCDRILVLHGGQIVESGQVEQIFGSPRHPYTQGLLQSTLRFDSNCLGAHS